MIDPEFRPNETIEEMLERTSSSTYPLDHPCPACQALPGSRCTAPTVEGRRPVPWFHNARTDLAQGWT